MIPTCLFNQNFAVFKALFADYSNEIGASEADRTNSLGRLGMTIGRSVQ